MRERERVSENTAESAGTRDLKRVCLENQKESNGVQWSPMESSGIERNREESSKAKVKQIRCFDLNFVLFRKILPVSKRKTVRLTKCVRAVSIERTVADRRTQLLLAFQWQIL